METPKYSFVTHWRFQAPSELVYALLSEPLNYPVWMKSLAIRVTPVSKGNPDGVGREDYYELCGFLPYTLRWNLKCVEAEYPNRFKSESSGDMKGTGEWTFQSCGSWVDVDFYWVVGTNKPFLRYFSWILRPLFKWNHNWVMRRWQKDLQAELERRKGD